jgi:hypothetical protein
MPENKCTLCGRWLNVVGDELSGDCGGDCWGCIGVIEAEMGWEPSLRYVTDEWRRGLRPDWTPPAAATKADDNGQRGEKPQP